MYELDLPLTCGDVRRTLHVINGWTSLNVRRTTKMVSASLSSITEYFISGDTISIFCTSILCTRSKSDLVGLLAHMTISFTSVSPLSNKPFAKRPTRMTPFRDRVSSALVFWESGLCSMVDNWFCSTTDLSAGSILIGASLS